MKKSLIAVVVLALFLVAGALVAPGFVDWNEYRAVIAAEARKATGRRLAIEGDIAVALLPVPQLTAAKVRLGNLDGAWAPDMARLEALDVRVAIWPLLTGKVEVSSIVLRGAEIELETLADGRVNWDFGGVARDKGGSAARPAAPGVGADAVRLEQVVVSRGRVSYRDSRKDTVETVEGIEARLAAETLAGPFVMRGRARLRGVPVALDARVGRLAEGRATPLTARLDLTEAKAHADIAGQITTGAAAASGAADSMKGGSAVRGDVKVQAAGENLAAVLGALGGGEGPRMLRRPFTLSGALAGDAGSIAFNDVVLGINGTRASGALTARLDAVTAIDVTVAVNTLDLGAWLAAPPPAKAPAAAARKGPATSPQPFALPSDIRVAFDGRIGGITHGKGALRDVQFQGVMDRGVISLARLAAQLPGGSEASVSGRVSAVKGEPQFEGRLEAKSSDAHALLDWLGVDHAAVASDRLRGASLRTGLGLGPERLELNDMDLRFDGTRVGGGVVVALRQRLALGANFIVDRINLDAYMAAPDKTAPADRKEAGAAAAPGAADKKGGGSAALPGASDKKDGGGLGAFDANIRARVDDLTVKGLRLKGVALDGTLLAGDLTLKSLDIADFAGGKLALAGKIAGIDKDPLPDLRFKLTTGAPDRLLAAAGLNLDVPAAKLRPFALDGTFQSEARATRIDATLAAGALRAGVKGTLADLATAPRLGLALDVAHPSYVEFARLFLPDFTPRAAGKGPFSFKAKAEGAGLDLKLTGIAARVGEADIVGTATLAFATPRPKFSADFKAGALVADHFIPAAVALAPTAAPRAANQNEGGSAAAPAGRAAGAPTSADPSPWSDAPLDLAELRAFDADVKIAAERLDWRAWRMSNPRIEMTLADGRFDLRRAVGKTGEGSFAATGFLAAPAKPGGTAELKADLDISRADLAKAMFNAADVDIVKGNVSVAMNVAGRGVSSRALVSSLMGAGKLEAVDGAVAGFDLGRVNERLKTLDQPTAFLSLLQTAMAGGTTNFSRLGGSFRIDKGVLRADDVALAADGGSGSATVVADLPRWTIDANGIFRLEGHRDAPAFRMALRGPLDRPKRIFNINELQAWLMGRAATGLLQQLIKKPAPAPAAPAPEGGQATPAPAPAAPARPEDFIRDIFDLLQKKK